MIRATWFFWLFFLCVGFAAGRETDTAQMSPRAEFIVSLTFAFLVAFWVVADARQREKRMGFGYPALVFFIWPIFAPLYLFQTRGVRGFLSLTGFVGMSFAATAVGAIVAAATTA